MKKHLLAVLVTLTGSFAVSAQNYSFTDTLSNNITGTTVSYTVPSNLLDTRHFTLTNTGSSSVTVKVKKTIVYINDASSTIYFCTGQNCYSPTQNLSYAVVLSPNGTCALTCDHWPNNMTGASEVRYTVVNQSNPNDTAVFTIDYNAVPAGIASHSLVKPSMSNPAPNPASSAFSISYKMGSAAPQNAKMVIYNMLGDRVIETPIEEMEGVVKMDISILEQGVYFCTLVSDGKTLSTRRLVVTH
jgi:hypothetical protein